MGETNDRSDRGALIHAAVMRALDRAITHPDDHRYEHLAAVQEALGGDASLSPAPSLEAAAREWLAAKYGRLWADKNLDHRDLASFAAHVGRGDGLPDVDLLLPVLRGQKCIPLMGTLDDVSTDGTCKLCAFVLAYRAALRSPPAPEPAEEPLDEVDQGVDGAPHLLTEEQGRRGEPNHESVHGGSIAEPAEEPPCEECGGTERQLLFTAGGACVGFKPCPACSPRPCADGGETETSNKE